MTPGDLFIISGPSGAGKGTLVRHLLERVPRVWCSISATTRAPREGEVEGQHYRFLTDAEFDDLVENEGLLEWASVHGRRYGTPRRDVEEHLEQGDSVILEIDPQGAFQVKRVMPEAILVFVMPPTFEALRDRLERRGTESPAQIEHRLQAAEGELEHVPAYDVVILNEDLDTAVNELVDCVERPVRAAADCDSGSFVAYCSTVSDADTDEMGM